MPTTPSRRLPGARLGSLAVVAALVLGGCGGGDDGDGGADLEQPEASGSTTTDAVPPVPGVVTTPDPLIGEIATAPDVVAALQRALGHRADDLRRGDAEGFRSGIAPRDPAFVAQQETYFANLRQLPLQTLTMTADPATLVRDGAAYDVNVAVTLQLAGFDAVPVTSTDRYRFAPVAGGRRYRLTSVTDPAWEARNGVRSQPWDTGPIAVRTGAGVLGIFDPASVTAAGPLLRSVETGIGAVAAVVPYDWSRTVVVYALSDDTFLGAIPDLPGGDPDELDAVAFPVLASTTAPAPGADPAAVAPPVVAGTRLVLHSRMLARTGPSRDRLVRHELTHAAVGVHDDHAPVWLSEGLAEYVSVQAEVPEDRRVAARALAAARAGFEDLPSDDGFNGDDSAAHYAVSWWACEYLALGLGQPALWTLLDQLEAQGVVGTLDRAGEDATLTALAGINTRTLARKAGKLLVATFEPPPVVPTVDPSALPPPVPAPGQPTTYPTAPATAPSVPPAP